VSRVSLQLVAVQAPLLTTTVVDIKKRKLGKSFSVSGHIWNNISFLEDAGQSLEFLIAGSDWKQPVSHIILSFVMSDEKPKVISNPHVPEASVYIFCTLMEVFIIFIISIHLVFFTLSDCICKATIETWP